jgi:hypothetical protein
MDREWFIHAGLYDPSAPGAEQRLELLDYLAAEGITIDEMVTAHHEGRLTIAAAEPLLRGGQNASRSPRSANGPASTPARSAHMAG